MKTIVLIISTLIGISALHTAENENAESRRVKFNLYNSGLDETVEKKRKKIAEVFGIFSENNQDPAQVSINNGFFVTPSGRQQLSS
jgi:hypothetical protein